MALLESRLDSRIERLAQARLCNRGRRKIYSSGGKLKQAFKWTAPIHEFDFTHGLRTIAEFEALRAMWYVVNFTPYEGFRLRHWGDYSATMTNTFVIDLGAGSYQLARRYTTAGINFDRLITKPNSDAVLRDAGGIALTATISTTTGIATAVSGGTPAAWTGTFDVPATFADDSFPEVLEASQTGEPLVLTQSLTLEELRP
jgi:uncharacterized protein (TIGR02217 family)